MAFQPQDIPRTGAGPQDQKPTKLIEFQAGKGWKVTPLSSLPKLSPPWHGQHKMGYSSSGEKGS